MLHSERGQTISKTSGEEIICRLFDKSIEDENLFLKYTPQFENIWYNTNLLTLLTLENCGDGVMLFLMIFKHKNTFKKS